MKRLAVLVLLMCSIPLVGFASDLNQAAQEGRFFVNPMIGGFDKESTDDYNPEINYSLGLGYNYSANLSSYFAGSYSPDRRDQDTDLTTASIGALYHFMPEERLVPYVTAALGYLGIDGKDGLKDENEAQFNYGVGLKYFIGKDIALNTEVRHMLDTGGEPNSLLYQAGLVFFLGEGAKRDSDNDGVLDENDACPGTPASAPVDSKGCALDSDNDGVFDYRDKCPDTPAGAPVDKKGCALDSDNDGVFDYKDKCPDTPKGVAVNSVGCGLDSDNDGVIDADDACPDTPAGAPVDSKGCSLDSDNDGVIDFKDRCPNTPAGAQVDENGCQLKIHLVVEFDTNSAAILERNHDKLAKAVQFINEYPGQKIMIAGHTDSVGNAEYNQQLSQERADAVKAYLVKEAGLSDRKLVTKGFGEEKPLASNDTDAGRQQNRRVELSVFMQ
ncbi:MAG: OmpA family protein [Desulfuromonadaceae bacterium]|nr:OmpA family protein [Geobacteraceae bacterium]